MALRTRVVEIESYRGDGSPRVGDVYRFRLKPGSYAAGGDVPRDYVEAEIGEDGMAAPELWANGDAQTLCYWECVKPDGSTFQAILTYEDFPITLAAFEALALDPASEQGQSIMAIVEAQFTAAFNAAIPHVLQLTTDPELPYVELVAVSPVEFVESTEITSNGFEIEVLEIVGL